MKIKLRQKRAVRTTAIVVAMIAMAAAGAQAHYLMPVLRFCNYRSLLAPDCTFCEPNVANFNRDWPQGASNSPTLSEIWFERQNPYPNENLTIRMRAANTASALGKDFLPMGAQQLLWTEMWYSLNQGSLWYGNNHAGTRPGTGASMDFFTRQLLTVQNQGNIRYRWYVALTRDWAISPLSSIFSPDLDIPAPNRRCSDNPAENDPIRCPQTLRDRYVHPWNDACPWGFLCPIYDVFPPNTGQTLGWPAPYCSKAGGNCNISGYPEGGGDLLDYFPTHKQHLAGIDGFDPNQKYPSIPGHPLIRVNGVPGIDCDLWDGTAPDKPIHQLCGNNPNETIKEAYDRYGIKAYKISPMEGMVKFYHALKSTDVVDASFYTQFKSVWTTKLDLKEPQFAGVNVVGGRFITSPRVYDTCGNMAAGTTVPPFPTMGRDTNEAFVGVTDFHYDQVPQDQDLMIQYNDDDKETQCSATNTWCPTTTPKTRDQKYIDGACADPNCECCFNQCSPTICDYVRFGGYNGDPAQLARYTSMCRNIGDAGNPPGCGPEFGGNRNMSELHEFKISHSASNIYMKMKVAGEIIWGCYGSWFPLIGCEYSFGQLGSKINAYSFQVQNPDTQSTFYLLVIPEIPIYGAITAFLDINKFLSGGYSSTYDGKELERYADGLDCRGMFPCGVEEPPDPDPCEVLGCGDDPCSSAPLEDCDGDGKFNCDDACPCEEADTEDGCPEEEGGLGIDKYLCSTCNVEVNGNEIYLEMSQMDTIGSTGLLPVVAYGMVLSVHTLDFDCIFFDACRYTFNLGELSMDQSPRISYYLGGNLSKQTVTLSEDFTPPLAPIRFTHKYIDEPVEADVLACLGRCDELNKADSLDNDGDEELFAYAGHEQEIQGHTWNYIDEGYDPTATQVEVRWKEVLFNDDALKKNITDLGGYQLFMATGRGENFNPYYTICTSDTGPNGDPTGTCYGHNSITRDSPQSDDPYPDRPRFPAPYLEQGAHSGFGFPGQFVNCIIDTHCVPEEGCSIPNCKDDDAYLPEDGQTYWFKLRAFDLPRYVGAGTGTAYINYSPFTESVKVQILKNTVPPAAPTLIDTYPMNDGQSVKVVWRPNKEEDLGGYVIYRCPANPIDAVKITLEEGLEGIDRHCRGDETDPAFNPVANYRRVHAGILDKNTGYYIDKGLTFIETGLKTDGTPIDERGNWTTDDGVDNAPGSSSLGEGDGWPTPGINSFTQYPGETGAYEMIDCAKIYTSSGGLNPDLKHCGNLDDDFVADPSWWATYTPLFDDENNPKFLYDVSQHPNYDQELHQPVLFHNGLVDGYRYYYIVKAVDSPFRGDGWNEIGSSGDTCIDGVRPYEKVGQKGEGCVNPIQERTCDDPSVAYDWLYGGNCSAFATDTVTGLLLTIPTPNDVGRMPVPADTQAPQTPLSLKATVKSSGTAVQLDWSMPNDDRTINHFSVYRSRAQDRMYACLHGGCQESPFTDGCRCENDSECAPGRECVIPINICTNPPYYSIQPQTSGCEGASRNDGCQCTSDSQCGVGRSCTYQYKICLPEDSVMTAGDRIDNDGDGVIDEELADGLDNDGDGLIDEDLAGVSTEQWLNGKCPDPVYPYNSLDNQYRQERIRFENPSFPPDKNYVMTWKPGATFTDYSVKRSQTYFYRVTATDNAVYKPFDDPGHPDYSPGGNRPPPPNESIPSMSIVVTTVDTAPPAEVAGTCGPDETMPCAERREEGFCPAYPQSDMYGGSMTIHWNRSAEADIKGYNVYRASSAIGEPPNSAYKAINPVLIPQPAYGTAATICFKDAELLNDTNYYYMVTAVDENNNESTFSEAYDRPSVAMDTTPPMAPVWGASGGATSDINGLKMTIRWMNHVDYAPDLTSPGEIDFSHFSVYRSENDAVCEPSERIANDLSTNTYVDEDVEKNTQYYYCVTAFDTTGNESDPSIAMPGKPTDTVPPSAPTGLILTPLAGAQVGAGWKTNLESDLACYILYWSTSTTESSFQMITPGSASDGYKEVVNYGGETVKCTAREYYTDTTTRTAGVTYYFKIAAVDDNGNIGPKSDYATIVPATLDRTAPGYPSQIWTLPGFSSRERPDEIGDGLDNNGNGIIDDNVTYNTGQVVLFWSKALEPDVASYKIYRVTPPALSGCVCNVSTDPQGDCDNDGIVNIQDDACPCTPVSRNTSQFGDYELINTVTKAQACPSATTRPYPVGTRVQEICYSVDQGVPPSVNLCPETRYWYAVVPVDQTGNALPVDKSRSAAATPVKRTDTTAPDKPAKPDIEQAKGLLGLVVKFTENTGSANNDLFGYKIYRDTRSAGDYQYLVTDLMDATKLHYCDQVGVAPCFCNAVAPTKACFVDVSVVEGQRYFYKLSAYDISGNESAKSDPSFAVATQSAPAQPAAFCARSQSDDMNSLVLSWDDLGLLNKSNIAGFQLRRSRNKDYGSWAVIDPYPDTQTVEYLKSTSFIDTGLQAGVVYCYMILTMDVNNMESPPVYTCAVPGENLSPPLRPTGVVATPGNNKVTLDWSRNSESNLIGYNIYRTTVRDGDMTKINSVPITLPGYVDTSVSNGVQYWYCVKALDNEPRSGENTCYADISNESSCSSRVTALPSHVLSGSPSTMGMSVARGWNLMTVPSTSDGSVSFDGAMSGDQRALGRALSGSGYNEMDFTGSSGDVAARGFWYYSESDGELQVTGIWSSSPMYELALEEGWSLIGNPFDVKIYWDDVNVKVIANGTVMGISQALSSGIVSGAFIFNPNAEKDYEPLTLGAELHRQGLWIKLSQPATIRFERN
ncbi:MAG TPA: hypothetical protein PKH33_17835 [bacterium]|nr:hypothetical protein [bacterium]